MNNFSLTYLAVIALTALGVEGAESVVNAGLIIGAALVALYGRYRAGGVTWIGTK